MRLSAKPIITWNGVNSYVLGNQWVISQGDSVTLYFQIFDSDQAINNSSLRYLIGIGSSNQPSQVSVTFPSIDDTKILTLLATQVDPNDSSIWQINLTSDIEISGGNVQFTIEEGNKIKRFNVINMINVEYPTSNGMC